ncbi:MAG: hypothetical protein Q4B08_00575 [Propionibacteriaceae bacterium]|nr:hypothetical protein [Propionibacteriaceae bacterium]
MSEQRGKRPIGTGSGGRSDDGMRILSYLIAGLLFYGGLGYAGDWAFGTGWLLPTGLVAGLVISIYVIIKRYGSIA